MQNVPGRGGCARRREPDRPDYYRRADPEQGRRDRGRAFANGGFRPARRAARTGRKHQVRAHCAALGFPLVACRPRSGSSSSVYAGMYRPLRVVASPGVVDVACPLPEWYGAPTVSPCCVSVQQTRTHTRTGPRRIWALLPFGTRATPNTGVSNLVAGRLNLCSQAPHDPDVHAYFTDLAFRASSLRVRPAPRRTGRRRRMTSAHAIVPSDRRAVYRRAAAACPRRRRKRPRNQPRVDHQPRGRPRERQSGGVAARVDVQRPRHETATQCYSRISGLGVTFASFAVDEALFDLPGAARRQRPTRVVDRDRRAVEAVWRNERPRARRKQAECQQAARRASALVRSRRERTSAPRALEAVIYAMVVELHPNSPRARLAAP